MLKSYKKEVYLEIMTSYESMGVIRGEALILQALEGKLGVHITRVSLERVNFDTHNNLFALNDNGHIIGLRLSNYDDRHGPLGYITEDICSLTSLEYLYLVSQNISIIPAKIKELTKLALLDLLSNPIAVIPHELIELSSLKAFYFSGENSIIPYINVLPFLKTVKFKGNLEIGKLWHVIQDDLDTKKKCEIAELNKERKIQEQKQKQQEELNEKLSELKVPKIIKYPPKEILFSKLEENRDFEYVILWMLFNNDYCTWSELKSKPLNISQATLSKYLSLLVDNRYVYKVTKGYYVITESGKRRLSEIESSINK